MAIFIAAHERLCEALEDDFGARLAAAAKFETWESEHSDLLRRLRDKISEAKQETQSVRSRRSSRYPQSSKSSSSSARKDNVAARLARIKTELEFVDAEV